MCPLKIVWIFLKIRETAAHFFSQPFHEAVFYPLYTRHIGKQRIHIEKQRKAVLTLSSLFIKKIMPLCLVQHQPARLAAILTAFLRNGVHRG